MCVLVFLWCTCIKNDIINLTFQLPPYAKQIPLWPNDHYDCISCHACFLFRIVRILVSGISWSRWFNSRHSFSSEMYFLLPGAMFPTEHNVVGLFLPQLHLKSTWSDFSEWIFVRSYLFQMLHHHLTKNLGFQILVLKISQTI